MTRRYLPMLVLGLATAFASAGIHSHLRAQESKPASKEGAETVTKSHFPKDTRPNLHDWIFPGMMPKNNRSFPKVAILTGFAGPNYAEVFDFYAKKIGANGYNLKEMTTFQDPNHELLTSVSADFDASGNVFVDSQNMQATFCQRTAHESVSIFISKNKKSNMTSVSLTSTTF